MPSHRHAQPPTDDPEPPPADLAEQLVPIAAELVGCVHDYGPDTVHDVLAQVPTHQHAALAVVLAAMVDPDRTPAELLAWLEGPVASRTFEPTSMRPDLRRLTCTDCGRRYRASSLARHRRTHAEQVA